MTRRTASIIVLLTALLVLGLAGPARAGNGNGNGSGNGHGTTTPPTEPPTSDPPTTDPPTTTLVPPVPTTPPVPRPSPTTTAPRQCYEYGWSQLGGPVLYAACVATHPGQAGACFFPWDVRC